MRLFCDSAHDFHEIVCFSQARVGMIVKAVEAGISAL